MYQCCHWSRQCDSLSKLPFAESCQQQPHRKLCGAGLRWLLGRLQAALNTAADEVAGGKAGPSSKHLKPIVNAVEMVFASAAALSAAFGLKVLTSLETLDDARHASALIGRATLAGEPDLVV